MTLSEVLSGNEDFTWIGPLGVSAYVNGKEIRVHYQSGSSPQSFQDYRGKDVVFVEHTVDKATYTADVLADSVEDIRVEMSLSERWTLPDGREVEIYSLNVVSPTEVDLEYQDGGGGYISGELITADGKSVELDEEEDDDTGECRVRVSED